MALAGWANPHRDPDEQYRFLTEDFHAEVSLTQVVTHHSPGDLETLARRLDRDGIDLPLIAGIFHFHNANPRRLEMLGRYFPVPAEQITRAYASGMDPEAYTATAVRSALDSGARAVYISNLGMTGAPRRLERILAQV